MYFVLKTETFAKLFFIFSCVGLFTYAALAFYTFHTAYSNISQLQKYEYNIPGLDPKYKVELEKIRSDLKYILVWTFNETNAMGIGRDPFIEQNCPYTNCYLTSDKFILEDVTKFEAIIFDVSILLARRKHNFPDSRSNEQKYIFHSNISSDDVPVCSVLADNFFNWTWSYRLDSDIFAPFFEVKDLEGNIIAPKYEVVNWNSNMALPDESVVDKLKSKKKAVAWIVTKCKTRNDRMLIAKRLQRLFRANTLDFDIFGCGNQQCPEEGCLKVLERDYYFYYAPEDSHAKDYVTSEVVVGYNHYAVPIVNGGADYRRFIPEGSYINVENNAPGDRLAALVEYIIRNPIIYYSFHRWRKHYTISETHRLKGLCEICEYLNDEDKFRSKTVKENFRKWWFQRPLYGRCVPKGAENLSEVLSFINESRRYKNG